MNGGVVFEYAHATRAGAQLTAWGDWVSGMRHVPLAFPFILFARGQIFSDERVVSFGLMFKLPVPIHELRERPKP